jgi:hypothetical protein
MPDRQFKYDADRESRNQQDYQADLERREQEILGPKADAVFDSSPRNDPDVRKVLAQKAENRLTAEESIVRQAIFDVIDDGDPVFKRHWVLDNEDADFVNAQRLDFVDQVITRVRAIKRFDDQESF